MVSIIVPSFNTREVLLRTLGLLRAALIDALAEVIVVDNASADGSADAVASHFPDVQVIRNQVNRGFAGAVNQGLAEAGGKYWLLLNSDTEVPPGFLEALVRYVEARPEVAVVAPRLLNSDGTDQGTARTFPTPAAFFFGRKSPLTKLWPSNPLSARYLIGRQRTGLEPFEVDTVSGACMLVRAAAARQIGLLDEQFFIYWEDADWCRRFKAARWKVVCVPGVTITHHEGLSGSGYRTRLIVHFHRSVYRYFCKHHARGRKWLEVPAAVALTIRAAVLVAIQPIRVARRQRVPQQQ